MFFLSDRMWTGKQIKSSLIFKIWNGGGIGFILRSTPGVL
jgi:hypothetical protein